MKIYTSSITKAGNGYKVFYRYHTLDGEVKSSSKRGFKLKREAQDWEQNELPKLIKELRAERTPNEKMTMKELIDDYIKDFKVSTRNSTAENKLHIINEKILPYFNKQKVFNIKPYDIKEWQNKIREMRKSNGEQYAPTYYYSINAQLKAIFNYAVMYFDLPYNPVTRTKAFGSKKSPQRRKYWTFEEYSKFSKAIEDNPLYYYAFETLFWTGIRMGELRAIKRKNIDLENLTIDIENSFSKAELEQGEVKSINAYRTIHIPQQLADELRDYIDSLYNLKSNDLVFPVSKSGLHRVMTEGSESAGVKRITIHGLRHSHISLLLNCVSGVSVSAISDRAGHSTTDVTMIYSHAYDNSDELIASQLNDMMKGGAVDVSKKHGQI